MSETACSAAGTSYNIEMLHAADSALILSSKQITKELIRMCRYVGLSDFVVCMQQNQGFWQQDPDFLVSLLPTQNWK